MPGFEFTTAMQNLILATLVALLCAIARPEYDLAVGLTGLACWLTITLDKDA